MKILALFPLLLVACSGAPAPAQQAQDGAALYACIQKDWDAGIKQVAHDCTGDAEDVAIDVVTDIASLMASHGGDAGAPPAAAADPRVQAKLAARMKGAR